MKTEELRRTIKLSPCVIRSDAWYYEDKDSIEIYLQAPGYGKTLTVRISYRQLADTLSRVDLCK